MALPIALPRRESRLSSRNARRPLAQAPSHPTNEELDGFRLRKTSEPLATALERHVYGCDRCVQRVADMVWHDLWDRLGA